MQTQVKDECFRSYFQVAKLFQITPKKPSVSDPVSDLKISLIQSPQLCDDDHILVNKGGGRARGGSHESSLRGAPPPDSNPYP